MVALAFLHLLFPQRFRWKDELGTLSLINRQLMYVHTFFIALMVLLMGTLCLLSGEALLTTTLGRQLSFGLFLFWFLRLLFQFFVYSPSLWRGKRFETTVHILFALLWTYFSAVFLMVCLQQPTD